MPNPVLAVIMAVLSTVTLPKIPASGGFGMLEGALVPPRYAATIPVLPELIEPAVEIEIELLFALGTEDPWFSAKIPELPELTVTPGSVVTSRTPNVEIAKIPVDVVPVMVAPPPTTILSAPFVWTSIPTVLPDTLP